MDPLSPKELNFITYSSINPNPEPVLSVSMSPNLDAEPSLLNPNPALTLSVGPHVSAAGPSNELWNALVAAVAAADSSVVAKKKKEDGKRSAKMVRVSEIVPLDQIHRRVEVNKTRRIYDSLSLILGVGEEEAREPSAGGKRKRADNKAGKEMRSCGLYLNREHRIVGYIPGIDVGDVFFSRAELCMLGLHGRTQAGIDYVPASGTNSGEPVATSIVVSGCYEDDEDLGYELIYTGEGGREKKLARQTAHQRLQGANLAMERSMAHNIEIRVIRGMKCAESPTGRLYVYDGLYRVVQCWLSVGKSGFLVYKNRLVRIPDQAEMGSAMLKHAAALKANPPNPLVARPAGYLSLDISNKKEKAPVFLFNNIDAESDPLLCEYIVSPVYPSFILEAKGDGGCECTGRCSINCPCARRNGGEFAYDANGILLRGKPLVYECGKWCQCPPSCPNRVSQKGIRHPLVVFRSKKTGWRLCSLDLIRAGSFVCELSGIVLTEEQSATALMTGCPLISPNKFPPSWKKWGDVSAVYPTYVPAAYPPKPELSFSLNVSTARNAGSYLSHSCMPNVFVQPVLFDHYNASYSHLMVFAMENIPPLREMSLDYGI